MHVHLEVFLEVALQTAPLRAEGAHEGLPGLAIRTPMQGPVLEQVGLEAEGLCALGALVGSIVAGG